MTDEYKLPQDKMLFSVDELKEAGFSHYKINQMVEKETPCFFGQETKLL